MVRAQMVPFGELLKGYRQAAALTQEELAERAGLSVRGIKALESGERTRPYRDTVRLLADALQLTDEERSTFEAAARAAVAPSRSAQDQPARPLPVGRFLGALASEPLVTREEELGRVLAALDAVVDGSGQFLVLAGETGIGKTRLAQEIHREALQHGFLVGTGRCHETEQAVSFSPFLELLATLPPPAGESVRDEMARCAPALNRSLPDGHLPEPLAAQEEQLCRAVTVSLLTLAGEAPVALLLDDLHWADGASLHLLWYLAEHLRSSRILLVGTYRDTELTREHSLEGVLRDLGREHLVERLAVHRLTAEGTAALVGATVGGTDDAGDFAEFVHRRTKGNPLFIDRMLRTLGGRYRLVRQIGTGGMGRVFEAIDSRTGKRVAAKIMFARTEADPKALQRFEQEGAVLATLQHPNIVAVYGTFPEERSCCIAMELVEGQTLGQLLRHPEGTRQLDLTRIKHLLAQVASALGCAHSRGIVHRDIKPDNIMVMAGDRVKVTDFGIARLLRPIDALTTMTSTGMTMGTPLYMAPEQIQGKKVDGRADIYSLGAVMYQIVSGRPPFAGDDPLSVALHHVMDSPARPRSLNPDLPRDWEALILKMLAKDPADRVPTAAALERALAGLSTGMPRRPRAAGGLLQRERVRIAATALALVVLAGGIYFTWSRSHATPSSRTVASRSGFTPWGWTLDNRVRLAAPSSIAVDQHGDVYVANAGTNTVDKFSPSGALLARWGAGGSGSARFDRPSSVAVDRQGHIFVVNVGTNHVQELSPTGSNHVQELSPGGKVLSELDPAALQLWGVSPLLSSVAVDPRGTVYVLDPGESAVVAFSHRTHGVVDWALPLFSPFDLTSMQIPSALAVDARRNVYVADAGTGRITEMSPLGDTIRQWSLRKVADYTQRVPARPTGLAVDDRQGVPGTLYVVDSANNRVLELSPEGKLLATWVPRASGSARFVDPTGVAVDARGNVYVVSRGSNLIQKLSPSGRLLAELGKPNPQRAQLDNPGGMAGDEQGDIYVVTGSSRNHIQKFAPSGRLIADWGPKSLDQLHNAYILGDVGVDTQGNVYATDVLHDHILKLSPRGRLLGEWRAPGGRNLQFGALSGMTVDRHGNVYVGDSTANRVLKLSRSGKVLARWTTGESNLPQHVAVDRNGNIYVAYTGNAFIQKFSPAGSHLLHWIVGRVGDSNAVDTEGVVVDKQGNLYVVDAGNDRIEKFTSQGELRGEWGKTGSQPGQFSGPGSVAVDGKGNVYVADTGNHRIQRLPP